MFFIYLCLYKAISIPKSLPFNETFLSFERSNFWYKCHYSKYALKFSTKFGRITERFRDSRNLSVIRQQNYHIFLWIEIEGNLSTTSKLRCKKDHTLEQNFKVTNCTRQKIREILRFVVLELAFGSIKINWNPKQKLFLKKKEKKIFLHFLCLFFGEKRSAVLPEKAKTDKLYIDFFVKLIIQLCFFLFFF